MLTRTRIAELMDDPNLDPGKHAQALHELEQLNALSISADLVWAHFKNFRKPEELGPVKVLDIATGGGDIPIKLSKYAQKSGKKFEFTGADISSTAVSLAKARARKENVPVSFIQLDALKDTIPSGFDIITTSLFTHHLDPPQVVNLFQKMREASAHIVLINDLIRSNVSLGLIWLATRIFSRSEIVRYDGPVSVKAAYTVDEMKDMAQKAGMSNSSVHSYLFCRQLLVWMRSA